jgi:hypothetical protein
MTPKVRDEFTSIADGNGRIFESIVKLTARQTLRKVKRRARDHSSPHVG